MKGIAFALGLLVFTIGLSTLIGYATQLPGLHTWTSGVGMAFNTGVAFALTGVAICVLSSRPRHKPKL